MTPGEKRRADRRYHRNEAGKAVREFRRNHELPALREMPHPKGRVGTAQHYLDWLIDNGYQRHALSYLESLVN